MSETISPESNTLSAAEQIARDGVVSEVPGMRLEQARPSEIVSIDTDQVAIAQDRLRKNTELLESESARAIALARAARSGHAVVSAANYNLR